MKIHRFLQRDLPPGLESLAELATDLRWTIMQRHSSMPGALNGYLYRYSMSTARPYTDFIPRIVAYHPDARTPVENNLILWWSGVAELQRN